jgi:polysaccharide biosynthesis protein PelC
MKDIVRKNMKKTMRSHTFRLRLTSILPLVLCTALLSACSSFSPGSSSTRSAMEGVIARTDSVAMMPVANFTEVPQAGLRVEALLESTLRQIGLRQLKIYPSALNPETLFEPGERKAQAEAEKWARSQNIRYAVSAVVNEWRYKVGVDGEPAVGIVVQVKDLSTDQIVYSAAGGRTGGSREALAAVGLQLTSQLVAGIRVESLVTPSDKR